MEYITGSINMRKPNCIGYKEHFLIFFVCNLYFYLTSTYGLYIYNSRKAYKIVFNKWQFWVFLKDKDFVMPVFQKKKRLSTCFDNKNLMPIIMIEDYTNIVSLNIYTNSDKQILWYFISVSNVKHIIFVHIMLL